MEEPRVLSAIQSWSRHLMQQVAVDGAYLFGSVLKGSRFVPERSDVDALLILSRSLRTPLARATVTAKLMEHKKTLEGEIEGILGARPDENPIASILLLTPFECDNAIHKGRDHRFFSTTSFLELSQPHEGETQLGSAAADLFRLLYPGLVPTVQRAQDFRNQFLSIDARGKRKLDAWDDQREALPKEICRAAAPLRYFERSLSDDYSEFDGRIGLHHGTGR